MSFVKQNIDLEKLNALKRSILSDESGNDSGGEDEDTVFGESDEEKETDTDEEKNANSNEYSEFGADDEDSFVERKISETASEIKLDEKNLEQFDVGNTPFDIPWSSYDLDFVCFDEDKDLLDCEDHALPKLAVRDNLVESHIFKLKKRFVEERGPLQLKRDAVSYAPVSYEESDKEKKHSKLRRGNRKCTKPKRYTDDMIPLNVKLRKKRKQTSLKESAPAKPDVIDLISSSEKNSETDNEEDTCSAKSSDNFVIDESYRDHRAHWSRLGLFDHNYFQWVPSKKIFHSLIQDTLQQESSNVPASQSEQKTKKRGRPRKKDLQVRSDWHPTKQKLTGGHKRGAPTIERRKKWKKKKEERNHVLLEKERRREMRQNFSNLWRSVTNSEDTMAPKNEVLGRATTLCHSLQVESKELMKNLRFERKRYVKLCKTLLEFQAK